MNTRAERVAQREHAASDTRAIRARSSAATHARIVRRRERPEQRGEVLDLVGLEEAEPLVDVGRDATRLERALELAMRVAGAEQDGDVAGLDVARHAGLAVAHGRPGRDQPHDLVGHARRPSPATDGSTTSPSTGSRIAGMGSPATHREPILLVVAERVAAPARLLDLVEQRR